MTQTARPPWRPTRAGQWVKFKAKLPEHVWSRHEQGLRPLHVTGDGWLYGLFVPEGRDPLSGRPLPARVMLVDDKGDNVAVEMPDGTRANIYFLPEDVQGTWAPVLSKEELPPHYPVNPDWRPAS